MHTITGTGSPEPEHRRGFGTSSAMGDRVVTECHTGSANTRRHVTASNHDNRSSGMLRTCFVYLVPRRLPSTGTMSTNRATGAHQAQRQNLATDVAHGHRNRALPRELLRLRDGRRHVGDEVVRRPRGATRRASDGATPRPHARPSEAGPPSRWSCRTGSGRSPASRLRPTSAGRSRSTPSTPPAGRSRPGGPRAARTRRDVPVEQRPDLIVLVGDEADHDCRSAPLPRRQRLACGSVNIGATRLQLSGADFAELDDAATRIGVAGARYNEAMARLSKH